MFGKTPEDRKAVYDLYCETQDGSQRFFRVAEIALFSPDERIAYEQSLKNMRDYNNTVKSAEWKGEQRGLEEGRAEGRAEGRTEGQKEKTLEIARNLKKLNLSISEIEAATGLKATEIEEL